MMAHGLTALRFVLAWPVALAFARPGLVAPWLLLTFIVAAIITDYFDGIVARTTGTASSAGQLFDHATDFLFVTAGLSGAAYAGLVTPLLPPLIVVAFCQYVLDSRFLYRDKQLRMSFLGRWNGLLYFVPLVVLALARLEFLAGFSEMLSAAAAWLGWLLVVSTMLSIADRAMAPLRSRQWR